MARLGAPDGAVTRRTLAEAVRATVAVSGASEVHLRGPGWRIDADWNQVMVDAGDDLGGSAIRSRGADEAVEVQVFGLTGGERVRVRCAGAVVRVSGATLVPLSEGWHVLSSALGGGQLLCTGGPWSVRVGTAPPRDYAGVFVWRPAPDRHPEAGETARQTRARRGSNIVFRTTLGAYVAGVLAAEHEGLGGEARLALARVIAHDASVARHPGRPVCDTTHCQVFRGTARMFPEDRMALSLPPLPTRAWLPYFRGGHERWSARRPVGQVRAILGQVKRLDGEGQQLQVSTSSGTETRPCEPVRSALRLPACPRSAELDGQTVVFHGEGQGHGLGLDVAAAIRSPLPAKVLLERAYGLGVSD